VFPTSAAGELGEAGRERVSIVWKIGGREVLFCPPPR